jgi:hypothetical protein
MTTAAASETHDGPGSVTLDLVIMKAAIAVAYEAKVNMVFTATPFTMPLLNARDDSLCLQLRHILAQTRPPCHAM